MNSPTRITPVAAENEEATEAWSGVLFDRFVQYREVVVQGLAAFGDVAMQLHPPRPGARVLDIGCGFGDTTQQLARLVGPEGSAVGVDVSEPFVAAAVEEASEAGAKNVEFLAGDVQVMELPGPFDHAFSRMGVMFFANPVAAFRNISSALAPGALLCAVVWRRKIDNEWLYRAEQVVDRYLEEPEETDEPRCGPGPFSMADTEVVTKQLQIAGYTDVKFERVDADVMVGRDIDEAVAFQLAIGPAGEVVREAGAEAKRRHHEMVAGLTEELSQFVRPEGVMMKSSSWIVTARNSGASVY